MLRITNISKRYATRAVLERVSFVINDGDVTGIVGPNGAGKSTLLRIIAGEIAADGGAVEIGAEARIGHLRQGYGGAPNAKVRDIYPSLFAREAIEAEVIELGARLSDGAGATAATEQAYEDALARLNALPGGGTRMRDRAALDLREIDPDERMGNLSGGEQTKLGLLDLATARPGALLLDEPTNNLDLRGMAWLDDFLGAFAGPILIVSHDRALLDGHASQILALDGDSGRLDMYEGGYSDYAREQQRRRDAAWDAYRRQRDHDARMEREVRAIKATAQRREHLTQNDFYRRKAKNVARRATVLERRLRREQQSEERVEKPIARAYTVRPDMMPADRSGDRMLAARGLTVRAGGRALLSIDEFTVGWGERVVITGANGSGKTTFLRTLAGELAADGQLKMSPSARSGYLPQRTELTPEQMSGTPADLVRRSSALSETEARRFLHRFLFSGDDARTRIEQLSYGEQRRLWLATLVLAAPNLLILDEPTNHLDIPSQEAFEETLSSFDGAIVAVTHDRYLIDRLADRVLAIEGGRLRDGRV